jgi:hypothetical protein
VHIELSTTGNAGRRVFFDSLSTGLLPTGGAIALHETVPILTEDLGLQVLTARVISQDQSLTEVVQVVADSFYVAEQAGLNVVLKPNPVRGDPDAAILEVELNRAGSLQVEIFNLEGQRVGSSVRNVVPKVTTPILQLPLLAGSGTPAELASGTYLVNVQWRGDGGESAGAMKPWVVIR